MTSTDRFDRFLEDVGDAQTAKDAVRQSSVVCAATIGNPVLYVSDAFEAHTGFPPQKAIGRNLSFLQGPKSEPDSIEMFRDLIKQEKAGLVRITNYRIDGTLFVHECDFRPVRNAQEVVTHFIAIQRLIV